MCVYIIKMRFSPVRRGYFHVSFAQTSRPPDGRKKVANFGPFSMIVFSLSVIDAFCTDIWKLESVNRY